MKSAPLTLVQQVVGRHTTDQISVGSYATVRVDVVVVRDSYWPEIERVMERVGVRRPFDPDRVVLCFDHMNAGALSPPYVEHYAAARRWAFEQGLEHGFYDVGRGGLGQLVVLEGGHVSRPGMLVACEEANYSNIGVYGSLSLNVAGDIYVSMLLGEDFMRIPQAVLVELHGQLAPGVTVRDLGQVVRRDAQSLDNIVECALEYVGPGIASLSLDARETLLALTGSWDIGIMEPDQLALERLRERGGTWAASERPAFDPRAPYRARLRYELSELEPQVALPGQITSSVPLGAVRGRAVDVASIGSCAGGRYEDLASVAHVLSGKRVHPRTRLLVTPGSMEVQREARRSGVLDAIEAAGGTVFPPGCGQCFGYIGALADGEVCISNTQVNTVGRMGSRSAEIYLASAYSVAAAALAGEIADPRGVLG